jgi:hypothetical protein
MVAPDSDAFPGTVTFNTAWGDSHTWPWINNFTENEQKAPHVNQRYAAYQDPAAWYLAGKKDIAKKQVAFLKESQKAYANQNGDPDNLGPFFPVNNHGNWTWAPQSADPNTGWMGFQYRPLRNLVEYYVLSHDPEAKQLIDNFNNWVFEHSVITKDKVELPTELTKFSENIQNKGYEPHGAALLAQSWLLEAVQLQDKDLAKKAEYLLTDLLRHQEPNGSVKNADGYTYNFHQAEILKANIMYARMVR